jgi:hypothetical protein
VHGALLAVVNSTLEGTAPPLGLEEHSQSGAPQGGGGVHPRTGSGSGGGGGSIGGAGGALPLSAHTGGCVAVEGGALLLQDTSLSRCNARFVGGGVSAVAAALLAVRVNITGCYADMVRRESEGKGDY